MKSRLVLLLAMWTATCAADTPFASVMIDAQTEKRHGAFPLDRALVADGIERIKTSKARGIVLKFILDLPRNAASDARLARAFAGIPVLLEARVVPAEKHSNPLPQKFVLNLPPPAGDDSLSGESGWIPLPLFAAQARDIGFCDVTTPTAVPILEKYQGKYVKSISLCALEMALDATAQITPGTKLTLGGREIPLDGRNQVPIDLPGKDAIDYIPFHDLLAGRVDPRKLAGKVVILAYDGDKIHSLETPIGKVKAHRIFILALEALYRKVSG